ncbi:hypothetical protein SASPL_153804 [Salvia splendens]|uniref:Uncharacterized protein n=1 Tax=Salvia splendens TaxID=180675 RepID=A0A8X8VZ05_SALSN|nr:uncharacterized protein LOC121787871 [Salvia splendens]KAG6384981.1 hypothetical protein SASPL_153804 [Salvia splendens]
MPTSQLIKLVQDSLDSTMPYIAMYIAAASAVCTLAMAADAFIAFRTKMYWLPCNYFSLTVLAVAMKLPLDLTALDLSVNDKFARISSLVLMSTAVSNFMTSLGSMEDNEIVLNMAALGILVVTIAGNVCIHIAKIHSFEPRLYLFLPQQIATVVIMLLFLTMLCCMSLMVPGAKRYIGLRYNEMHKSVSKNRQVEWGKFSSEELENMVKGYWVMAQTSSPQFVLARSAISSVSGVLCLFTALFLVQVWFVRNRLEAHASGSNFNLAYLDSNYGPSVYWILAIQTIGVVMGTLAPVLRWLAALWFKISETEGRSFRDELKVDKYWTWRLEEWRDSPLPFHVQNRVCKKILRDVLRFVLNLCIGVQILFVSAGKLVLFISSRFGSAVFFCFCKNKRPVSTGAQVDFSQYVLLEGEPRLPYKILKNICNEADKLTCVGEEKQPRNLIQLLKKSSNFKGVG